MLSISKLQNNKKWQKIYETIATAKWMDLIGVLIVILVAISAGYATETLKQVKPEWGAWTALVPFGIISIGNTVLSIMSTRLTGRMKYSGNIVGIINVFFSGTIDYLLGNSAAPLSYTVTFVIYIIALYVWNKYAKQGKANEAAKPLTGKKRTIVISLIFAFAFPFSFWINWIGFKQFNVLFVTTWIVFALSLIANILNAMKLSMQNGFWIAYDVAKLTNSIKLGNWANFGKYVYYIISITASLFYWNARNPKKDNN